MTIPSRTLNIRHRAINNHQIYFGADTSGGCLRCAPRGRQNRPPIAKNPAPAARFIAFQTSRTFPWPDIPREMFPAAPCDFLRGVAANGCMVLPDVAYCLSRHRGSVVANLTIWRYSKMEIREPRPRKPKPTRIRRVLTAPDGVKNSAIQ